MPKKSVTPKNESTNCQRADPGMVDSSQMRKRRTRRRILIGPILSARKFEWRNSNDESMTKKEIQMTKQIHSLCEETRHSRKVNLLGHLSFENSSLIRDFEFRHSNFRSRSGNRQHGP